MLDYKAQTVGALGYFRRTPEERIRRRRGTEYRIYEITQLRSEAHHTMGEPKWLRNEIEQICDKVRLKFRPSGSNQWTLLSSLKGHYKRINRLRRVDEYSFADNVQDDAGSGLPSKCLYAVHLIGFACYILPTRLCMYDL